MEGWPNKSESGETECKGTLETPRGSWMWEVEHKQEERAWDTAEQWLHTEGKAGFCPEGTTVLLPSRQEWLWCNWPWIFNITKHWILPVAQSGLPEQCVDQALIQAELRRQCGRSWVLRWCQQHTCSGEQSCLTAGDVTVHSRVWKRTVGQEMPKILQQGCKV